MEQFMAMKDNPCMDCNKTFPRVCMDFDHRPGTEKIADVSILINQSSSISKISKEIEKCDIVCSNCHRIRTGERRKLKKSGAG